jgi:phosphoribosylformimino-5-aminoimidazole carboxamide ribotide isomerase
MKLVRRENAENVKLFTKSPWRNGNQWLGGYRDRDPRGPASDEKCPYGLPWGMIVIPSMELRHGACVHPRGSNGRGGASVGTVVGVVRGWAQAGFRRIHVIDTDRCGANGSVVDQIISHGPTEVDVSNGAESAEQIGELLDSGATRVVIGARGLDEPTWLAGVADLYPHVLVVAAAVRDRRAGTRGWVGSLPDDLLDLVSELNDLPLGGLLVTSASDASPNGADLALLEDIAELSACPVIAAGGVSTMNDLRAFEHRGISAVVLREPLYSGALDVHRVAAEFGG